MHDYTGRGSRNPSRHPHAASTPLTRVTAQMWGLEQLHRSFAERGPRRRPLRAVAQWVAAAFGR